MNKKINTKFWFKEKNPAYRKVLFNIAKKDMLEDKICFDFFISKNLNKKTIKKFAY